MYYWHLLKATHKARYSDKWPNHTSPTKVNYFRTLWSSSTPSLYFPLVSNTFQDITSKSFNDLQADIRSCQDYDYFCRMTKCYLFQRIC